MSNDETKIISKIRKLLALANNAAATDGERDNAMRQAHAMLAKYNLDVATVEAATGKATAGEERVEQESEFYGRPWARRVCGAIAELFFCRYLYVPSGDAKMTVHSFIGRKSNATTAAEMSKYVVESILKEGRRRTRELGQGNAWRRSFCLGAAAAIQVRAAKMLDESTKPEAPQPEVKTKVPGTALVLASVYQQEQEANKAMVEKQYPDLKAGRGGKGLSSTDAAVEGARYGKTVSLSRQIKDDRVQGLIEE